MDLDSASAQPLAAAVLPSVLGAALAATKASLAWRWRQQRGRGRCAKRKLERDLGYGVRGCIGRVLGG